MFWSGRNWELCEELTLIYFGACHDQNLNPKYFNTEPRMLAISKSPILWYCATQNIAAL